MKTLRWDRLASLDGVSMGDAVAQAGGGKNPGAGPGPMEAGPTASATGLGVGIGPGGGRGVARWGADGTPGWALMTQQERNEHRDRRRAMETWDDCRACQDQHHEQVAVRTKNRGGKALGQPRRDACSGLEKQAAIIMIATPSLVRRRFHASLATVLAALPTCLAACGGSNDATRLMHVDASGTSTFDACCVHDVFDARRRAPQAWWRPLSKLERGDATAWPAKASAH